LGFVPHKGIEVEIGEIVRIRQVIADDRINVLVGRGGTTASAVSNFAKNIGWGKVVQAAEIEITGHLVAKGEVFIKLYFRIGIAEELISLPLVFDQLG